MRTPILIKYYMYGKGCSYECTRAMHVSECGSHTCDGTSRKMVKLHCTLVYLNICSISFLNFFFLTHHDEIGLRAHTARTCMTML